MRRRSAPGVGGVGGVCGFGDPLLGTPASSAGGDSWHYQITN